MYHEARRGKVKLSELKDTTLNYDKKRFPNCLKSMDYSVKQNVTPEISKRLPKRLKIDLILPYIFFNPNIVLSFKNLLGVLIEKVSKVAKLGIHVKLT